MHIAVLTHVYEWDSDSFLIFIFTTVISLIDNLHS